MSREVIRYVRSCSVCAQSKTPRHLPAGKLVPLPIPHRPWSHIGIDFVTDLPNSDGNTCVFVTVDHFSKACKLVPLSGLPTALEMAEILFNHVFWNYGIPEDIVSDRGPQFISRVWKALFRLLGVTVSLSSGYHPQTNGQTEQMIQELGRYLRIYCHSDQYSWSRFLPWAEFAQNCLRHPSTERPHSLSVHARLPAPTLPLVGRAVGGSSCGLLVPGERESVGLSSRPTPTGSAEAEEFCRCLPLRRSYLPFGTTGMVVHQGFTPPPALQEAESPLHRSVPDTEADKQSHLPASPTTQVQNSPHLSRVPPLTLLFFILRTPVTCTCRSPIKPPSRVRCTQSITVRSTVHYPEQYLTPLYY